MDFVGWARSVCARPPVLDSCCLPLTNHDAENGRIVCQCSRAPLSNPDELVYNTIA